jgi:hypothetical protein
VYHIVAKKLLVVSEMLRSLVFNVHRIQPQVGKRSESYAMAEGGKAAQRGSKYTGHHEIIPMHSIILFLNIAAGIPLSAGLIALGAYHKK